MLGAEGLAMADYTFEREARTPYSESYTVEDDGEVVGRVDLHFTPSSICYATICVPADFEEDDIQDLIAEIDERFVLSTDPYRDDFVVTVWRGAQAGVYSEEPDSDDDAEDAEEDDDVTVGNGRVVG
jgi:hypothetical protein